MSPNSVAGECERRLCLENLPTPSCRASATKPHGCGKGERSRFSSRVITRGPSMRIPSVNCFDRRGGSNLLTLCPVLACTEHGKVHRSPCHRPWWYARRGDALAADLRGFGYWSSLAT